MNDKAITRVEVPDTIAVMSHKYNIFLDDSLEEDGEFGCCSNKYHNILIYPRCHISERNTSLLHEVLHAICRYTSLKLEDTVIDILSEGLGQVLFSSFGLELDWSHIRRIDRGKLEDSSDRKE